jgi:hypothetical protein
MRSRGTESPRRRRSLLGAVAVALALAVSACTSDDDGGGSSVTAPPPPPIVANDLAANSAHRGVAVPGEGFDLSIDYWTSADIARWQTAGAKSLNLSLHLTPLPDAPVQDVLLYSLNVAVQVKATLPTFEGLVILSASDTATGVPGFLISAVYPYDTVINVPAMAPQLLERWRSVEADEEISSEGLRKYGVYANEITFTYELLIKNEGDLTYHKRTVTDVLTVPSDTGTA